jgi:hypothetical protein
LEEAQRADEPAVLRERIRELQSAIRACERERDLSKRSGGVMQAAQRAQQQRFTTSAEDRYEREFKTVMDEERGDD